jgi:integrase
VTVGEWCNSWLVGYGTRRDSTVRQAKVHLALIRDEFGPLPLASVRPSQVRSWLSRLARDGYAPHVYAVHSRLAQVMADAVHDGLLATSPCSRRTSPPMGQQRPYVATTEHVWGLYDTFPERLRVAVLLGAFAGLTTGETCGLRVEDVAFLGREIRPAVQWPAEELKTPMRRTAIPVADTLLEVLAQHVATWPSPWVLTGASGGQLHPRHLQREMRDAREVVGGLPEGFRYHDYAEVRVMPTAAGSCWSAGVTSSDRSA